MTSVPGFVDWPFMTVHSWAEDPRGTWTLEIHNDAAAHWGFEAKFFTWSLELFGTEFDPNKVVPSQAANSTTLTKVIRRSAINLKYSVFDHNYKYILQHT
jgi:subtilisin-like proprotein convertase family protein